MPDKSPDLNIQNTYRSSLSDLVMSLGAVGMLLGLIFLPGIR